MSIANFESNNFDGNDGSLSREDFLAMERVNIIKADREHTYIDPEERLILGTDFSEEYRDYDKVKGSQVVQLGSRVEVEQEVSDWIEKTTYKIKYKAIIFSKYGFKKTGEIYDQYDVIPYTSPLGLSIIGHIPNRESIVVRISEGEYTTVRILSVI
jgi:transcription elongation GreA/GreB family factor